MRPEQEDRSGLTRRFRLAWSDVVRAEGPLSAELLPTLLARAACTTLSADGAGISILDNEYRVPVGASNDAAAVAERLQFTVGEGPCLEALTQRRAVRVDEDQIRGQWPAFHAELTRETNYRSVVAVPIDFSETLHGALDVYFTNPAMADYVAVTEATLVAGHLTRMLNYAGYAPGTTPEWGADEMPAWMNGPQAQNRLRVWIAVGVLMVRMRSSAVDALALIRSYAYGQNQSLDDTSDAIIDGRLDPQNLT